MDGFSRREEPYQLNVFGEKITYHVVVIKIIKTKSTLQH